MTAVRHNLERGPPNDHPRQVWFKYGTMSSGEDLNVI